MFVLIFLVIDWFPRHRHSLTMVNRYPSMGQIRSKLVGGERKRVNLLSLTRLCQTKISISPCIKNPQKRKIVSPINWFVWLLLLSNCLHSVFEGALAYFSHTVVAQSRRIMTDLALADLMADCRDRHIEQLNHIQKACKSLRFQRHFLHLLFVQMFF